QQRPGPGRAEAAMDAVDKLAESTGGFRRHWGHIKYILRRVHTGGTGDPPVILPKNTGESPVPRSRQIDHVLVGLSVRQLAVWVVDADDDADHLGPVRVVGAPGAGVVVKCARAVRALGTVLGVG